jgi:hypothetical protein
MRYLVVGHILDEGFLGWSSDLALDGSDSFGFVEIVSQEIRFIVIYHCDEHA